MEFFARQSKKYLPSCRIWFVTQVAGAAEAAASVVVVAVAAVVAALVVVALVVHAAQVPTIFKLAPGGDAPLSTLSKPNLTA